MRDKIAQKLLESSLISQEQLSKAIEAQQSAGGTLSYNLVKTGAISEMAFAEFMGQVYNVPAVDLETTDVDVATVDLIPADVATRFQVVPVSREGRILTVAMANPDNIFAIDDIKFITGFEVKPVVATESAIKRTIDRLYESADSLASIEASNRPSTTNDPVSRDVTRTTSAGLSSRASRISFCSRNAAAAPS